METDNRKYQAGRRRTRACTRSSSGAVRLRSSVKRQPLAGCPSYYWCPPLDSATADRISKPRMEEVKLGIEPPHYCLGIDKTEKDLIRLQPWLEVLSDIRSYGSHLLPRCLDSSQRNVVDLTILGALFRQYLVFLDSTYELLRNGAVHASWHQLRGLFESRLSIHWILSADTDARALQFYVADLRQQRRDSLSLISGTPENQDQAAAQSHFNISSADLASDEAARLQAKVQKIDSILANPKFAAINVEFDRIQGNRPFDKWWFQPFSGLTSLAALAKDAGLEAEYKLLYSPMSRVSHASLFSGQMEFSGAEFSVKPIRSLIHFGDVLTLTYSYSIDVFRKLLVRYRSGEEESFSRRYSEKWQPLVMNPPTVSYESK